MALALSVKNSAPFAFVYLVNEYVVAAVARFLSLLGWAPLPHSFLAWSTNFASPSIFLLLALYEEAYPQPWPGFQLLLAHISPHSTHYR